VPLASTGELVGRAAEARSAVAAFNIITLEHVEAVLAGGLRPLFGPEVALALPLLFRLVTVTGDGVAFALGTLVRRTGDA